MAPTRKRSRTPDDDLDDEQSGHAAPLPPRRSTRFTTSKTGSTVAPPKAVSASASSKTKSRSGKTSLSDEELAMEVLKIVKNKDKAELLVLRLMRAYSFDLADLKMLLTGKLTSFE